MKVKIIYIVHSVSWKGGGSFFHAYHLAQRMVDLGHDVTLLSTSEKSRTRLLIKETDGIKLVEAPDLLSGSARSGWDILNTLSRIKYLWNKNYHVVHCLDCRPTVIFPGLFLKYFKGTKLILEWLDWFGRGGTAFERPMKIRIFMGTVETFFEEKFRKFADGTICLGVPLTERAKSLGIKKKITTILHGCDSNSLKAISYHEAISKLKFDKNKIYIGYVGRMREDVASLFIGVIRELRQKHNIDAYGLIIGKPAFNLVPYLQPDIKDYIILTGWIDYNMLNLYLCSSALLILPFKKTVSRNNIWPSKLNDYFCSGRPIISTKLAVISELFKKSNVGILCDDSVTELSSNCLKLLKNPKMAEDLGRNARKVAETILNWNTIAEKVNQFYDKILIN